MWELTNVTTFVERIRPLPWRPIVIVATVSFLSASAVSTLLGWLLMNHTATSSVRDTASDTASFSIATGPTLTKADIDRILDRNIFNSAGGVADLDAPAEDAGGAIAKTSLPIKVTGIIYGGDPKSGIAMIENTQKRSVNSFLVGDPLTPDATVKEVLVDRIIIENQGRNEYAILEEAEVRRSSRKGKKGPTKETPTTLGGSGYATEPPPESYKEEGFERKGTAIEMSTAYKNQLLTQDLSSVLQDAKASPNIVAGTLKGWRLDRIRRGSIYEKAGIQNNDVVTEINGVMLNDAAQAIKYLNGLRNESELDVAIERNGVKLNFNIKAR